VTTDNKRLNTNLHTVILYNIIKENTFHQK